MGIDAEHRPTDAVGQPRQHGPPETDRRAAAHTLRLPTDSVANGDVDAFILVVALLVGDIRDQFLVVSMADIGQIDGLHSSNPFMLGLFRRLCGRHVDGIGGYRRNAEFGCDRVDPLAARC